MEIRYTGNALWERIERAVEKVKDRLRRVTTTLNEAELPYAIVGGNAVQFWVGQVDESVVRQTQDVNIILNRRDLHDAIAALEKAGFLYRHAAGMDMFLDGPQAKARDVVHVVFAGEKVREDYLATVPLLNDCEFMQNARTLPLEALVRMKLTSFRRKDQVHLLDILSVGLLDETWLSRFTPELAERLRELIDDPDG